MTEPHGNDHNTVLEVVRIGRKVGDCWLLSDISLSVHAGERLALVGPSGSGKTLLVRVLSMLDPIDAGQVRWRGEWIHGRSIPDFRSRVIYLQQHPSLVEGTVEDNLRLPFTLRVHRAKSFDRARIVALLNFLGRDESFLSKQQGDLSGGESQITALLRSMQLDPEVLLLDEPTAALDEEATINVESLVRQWLTTKPETRATLWVSHDVEQARRVSDRIVQIFHGSLSDDF